MHSYLLFQMPGIEEWIVIAVIGVIVFGKRLPEVGKSLGQGIVQFKKGLKGIEDEVDRESSKPSAPSRPVLPQTASVENFKFDPITGKPLQQTPAIPPGAKFDPFTGEPLNQESETHASV